jgi:adenylate cyclase
MESARMKTADPSRALAEALIGAPAYTPREVAEEAGVAVEEARRLWLALGFPPVEDGDRVFTRADVEIVRAVRALIELRGASPEDLIQLTRVIGQSLARVADAQVTAAADRLERRRGEGTDAAAVDELVARMEALAPSLEQFLGYVWRRHLLAALRRRAAMPSSADHEVVVGFADLVGFTAMSAALAPHELAQRVDRFEALAYEHIPSRGGRVVKMIGDEVMFVTDEVGRGADIAVALAAAYARDAEMPDVRVGLAKGPALSWEGDLYGPTVNLASRLVNLARPNTVLVSDELGRQLEDDPRFELRYLRPVNLRGIGRVRAWVLRPASAARARR